MSFRIVEGVNNNLSVYKTYSENSLKNIINQSEDVVLVFTLGVYL